MNEIYITETEASLRYKYSKFWFQRCRWAGNGPQFLKIRGKILYPIKETDEWFSGHGLKNSTSE
jgi:hypothetical protein